MKKILLSVAILIAIVVLLPILGNKLIENTLNEKIETLKANGIELVEGSTESSYLQTKKHYKFLLKDANKLVEYLNKFASEKLPPYTHVMLEGALVGVDLDYSNIPLSKALSADIYPLTLSDRMTSDMQNKDAAFNTYLKTFLQNKGILYHINYDISSTNFDGYIKDIKEEQTLKNGALVTLNLRNARYSGSGELVAPTWLITSVETMMLRVADEKDDFIFDMQKLSTDSKFETQTTYFSNAKLEKLGMLYKSSQAEATEVNASGMVVNISSDTKGIKGELSLKSSMNSVVIDSDMLDMNLSKLNYEASLHGIDKDSLEEIRLLAMKLKSDDSLKLQEEFQNTLIKLLSFGLTLEVKDMSLQKIVVDNVKDLEGLSIKSRLTIKEDKELKQKIDTTPLLVLGNINVDTKIQFSKPLFDEMTKIMPMTALIQAYSKEEGNNLIFDIKFIDGAFKINDKPLNL